MDVMMAGWVACQAVDNFLSQIPLNLATGGLLLNLFAPCYLSSMVANKVIIFIAKSMANTAVHMVTNIHVIACMKICMILILSAHSY
jgi:hypothetical protein